MPSPDFWKDKTVLLTGHTGFKGAWLSVWLSMLGARVTGLSLGPLEGRSLYQTFGKKSVSEECFVDIRDHEALCRTVRRIRPEIILHLAAQSLVRQSYAAPVETFATNVMGTVHLLDALRDTDFCRAIVVVTSDKCYENREWVWPYRESDAMGGHDPYSASKGAAELVAASYRRSFFAARHTAVATARAGNVIGGGDWAKDRLVPDCLTAFARGETVIVRAPNATRPWQHVLEPLSGYLLLSERLADTGQSFAEGWNFGPEMKSVWPVRAVVDHLVAAWGEAAAWRLDENANPHEATLLAVDAAKAQSRLGWQPRLSVAEALDWTVAFHRALEAGSDDPGHSRKLCEKQIEDFTGISA